MKIIEVIKHSAELLGLQDTLEVLNTATEENEEDILMNVDVRKLLSLSALSIQEMCSNYISVYAEQEIETEDCKFALNKLKNYIRLAGVYENDQMLKFKVINRNVILEKDGKFTVRYCSYPDIESLFCEIDFLSNFNPDVLVMALCSYYAIAHGMFMEFDAFHEKYIEKAQTLKDLKLFELPVRRWE